MNDLPRRGVVNGNKSAMACVCVHLGKGGLTVSAVCIQEWVCVCIDLRDSQPEQLS